MQFCKFTFTKLIPMKNSARLLAISLVPLMWACAGNKEAPPVNETFEMNVKEETIAYSADSVTMNGFIAWNDADSSQRPVVLIVHEWWGLNDYARNRARQLAALGYFAMAVDMFGNGATANNPEEAKKLTMPFYHDPQLAKRRVDAALAKMKTHPAADAGKVAVIGYCFGGAVALNVARLGEDLKGAVSFHGSLLGVPPDKNLLKAEVLVCHGDSDKFVSQEEVRKFSHEMDSIGARYTVKHYANATHAFTNPEATENGKKFSLPIEYNAAADSASFNEMRAFFNRIFQ
jgi:dienelactone hydrolase